MTAVEKRHDGGRAPARRAAPGNMLAVSSGAFSERIYEPLALRLAERLLEDRPALARFPHELAALCRVETRALLLDHYLTQRGLHDRKGALREGALKYLATFERQAAAMRRELGLTPAGEARMRRDQALAAASVADIAAVMTAGAKTVTRRGEVAATSSAAAPGDGGSAGTSSSSVPADSTPSGAT